MDRRSGILGIDAGGTFTDLVFLKREDLSVETSVKIPTRHDDLLSTIAEGIGRIVHEIDGKRIASVHLASTLATNATVENKMAPSGLLLIGYDQRDIDRALERNLFGTSAVAAVEGGHDAKGNEKRPLDESGVLHGFETLRARGIEGLALSGYFSVRNPSHEIRARQILRENHPGLSITCGHELVSELDAFKRAATAAINAGLIPVIMRLFAAVRDVLRSLGVDAPLSIVKGDGSLVSVDWAQQHPIETIVSGPAASAMGARFLGSGREGRSAWVVDIGGTTTDIICLDRRGNPLLKNDGANIGGHEILIKTIDIRTVGLGGDSRISREKDGKLRIGPRRVTPLSVAAAQDGRVIEVLREMRGEVPCSKEPLLFRDGDGDCATASPLEKRVLAKLKAAGGKYLTVAEIVEGESLGVAQTIGETIARLEERSALRVAAFTPTDALLALGCLEADERWVAEASHAGAAVFAAVYAGYGEVVANQDKLFCEEVCDAMSRRAAEVIFCKALFNSGSALKGVDDAVLLEMALSANAGRDGEPNVSLHLNADVIGVGAPAWAFMEEAARLLGEEARLPENAAVAGAVGAAVGTFFLRHTVLITPLKSGGFRVHLPDGIRDFDDLEVAVSDSVDFMLPWMESLARGAGSIAPVIEWERRDDVARLSGGTQIVHLWTHLSFDATEAEAEPNG